MFFYSSRDSVPQPQSTVELLKPSCARMLSFYFCLKRLRKEQHSRFQTVAFWKLKFLSNQRFFLDSHAGSLAGFPTPTVTTNFFRLTCCYLYRTQFHQSSETRLWTCQRAGLESFCVCESCPAWITRYNYQEAADDCRKVSFGTRRDGAARVSDDWWSKQRRAGSRRSTGSAWDTSPAPSGSKGSLTAVIKAINDLQ